MKQAKFLLIWLALVGGLFAQGIQFTGYVRNYTGLLLTGDNEFSILQNTLNLNIEQSKDKVAFKVNPYMYHYGDSALELGLREAYLDIYFNSIDLRIGRQQIIWGKADGVFITDIVSPLNLTEFLLPDFDEIRTGVLSIKTNVYFGSSTIEAIIIPNNPIRQILPIEVRSDFVT